MRSDIELMKIHVEVPFTQDENACLRGVNEPVSDAKPAPRFFFGRKNEGSIRRFRYDLPENVVTQLKEVAAAKPMLMHSQKIPRAIANSKIFFNAMPRLNACG